MTTTNGVSAVISRVNCRTAISIFCPLVTDFRLKAAERSLIEPYSVPPLEIALILVLRPASRSKRTGMEFWDWPVPAATRARRSRTRQGIVLAVVHELNCKLQIRLFQQNNDGLEIVLALAADPDLVIHDLRLHLQLGILDHLYDDLRVLFSDAIL